jgi:hypothetical protein
MLHSFGVEKRSTSDGLVGVAMVHIDIKQREQGRRNDTSR